MHRLRMGVFSSVLGIILNILLFGLKLFVGGLAGSIAIMADSFNNLLDAASSVVTLFGFKLAGKPADKEHPFGHGRYEDVAGLIISGLVIFLAFEFGRNSIFAIINPSEISYDWYIIGLLALAFFAKIWQFAYNRRLGKKIDSKALLAVAQDSLNDCMITLATIISILLTAFFGIIADGYIGVLVALVLLRSGLFIAKESMGGLLGRRVSPEISANIKRAVLAQEGILAVHDLVVHSYGPGRNLATIHAEVDANMRVGSAHGLVDRAEEIVSHELGVQLVIHLDPVDLTDERATHLRKLTQAYLEEKHPQAIAHEFRIIDTAHCSKFIFDLEIPPEYDKKQALAAKNEIAQYIMGETGYFVKINIEHGYL